MAAPARVAAYRALRAIHDGAADLGDAIVRFRDPLNDPRDRALVTDLVTGTLRWRGALDYQIAKLSGRQLARLDPEVLDALRLGAYQLLHLERVPSSAVVNDAVALVKSRFKSATGFVNAVLRRLARGRETLTWPARPASIESEADRQALIEHLSVVQSHPRWLVERWLTRYGPDATEAWLSFNNRTPAITLAANRLRITRDELADRLSREGVRTRPTRIAPHGLIVEDGRALATETFRDGLCVVQDEASQLVGEVAAARPGHRVLDACAAPGGKTLALAAQAGSEGLVIATDVRARRVALLAQTLARCRASAVQVVRIPASGALPFADGRFDRILVDAPCSGLGTVRRDPDIRWTRQAEHLPALAAVQIELLQRLAPLLKQDGVLIYSTCSSEPEENDAVVAAFLDSTTGFSLRPLQSLAGVPSSVLALVGADGFLRTLPHRDGLEAFFAAAVVR